MTGSGSAGVRRKKAIRTDIPAAPPEALRAQDGPQTSKGHYAKQVMNSARCEILELRRRNELLAAKVDAMEIFAVALGMRNGQRGESIDVAWELQNAINSLD